MGIKLYEFAMQFVLCILKFLQFKKLYWEFMRLLSFGFAVQKKISINCTKGTEFLMNKIE